MVQDKPVVAPQLLQGMREEGGETCSKKQLYSCDGGSPESPLSSGKLKAEPDKAAHASNSGDETEDEVDGDDAVAEISGKTMCS